MRIGFFLRQCFLRSPDPYSLLNPRLENCSFFWKYPIPGDADRKADDIYNVRLFFLSWISAAVRERWGTITSREFARQMEKKLPGKFKLSRTGWSGAERREASRKILLPDDSSPLQVFSTTRWIRFTNPLFCFFCSFFVFLFFFFARTSDLRFQSFSYMVYLFSPNPRISYGLQALNPCQCQEFACHLFGHLSDSWNRRGSPVFQFKLWTTFFRLFSILTNL